MWPCLPDRPERDRPERSTLGTSLHPASPVCMLVLHAGWVPPPYFTRMCSNGGMSLFAWGLGCGGSASSAFPVMC